MFTFSMTIKEFQLCAEIQHSKAKGKKTTSIHSPSEPRHTRNEIKTDNKPLLAFLWRLSQRLLLSLGFLYKHCNHLQPCGILFCKTGLVRVVKQPWQCKNSLLPISKALINEVLLGKNWIILDCYLKKYFPQLHFSQVELDMGCGRKTWREWGGGGRYRHIGIYLFARKNVQ